MDNQVVSSPLLDLMARPIGDLPQTTFPGLLDQLGRYSASSLALGFTDIFWRAGRHGFTHELSNEVGTALAPPLCALSIARATGATEADFATLVDLHFRYLGIRLPSRAVNERFFNDLAKAMIGSSAEFLIPDRDTARYASSLFSMGRIMNAQWLPTINNFADLIRTWWLARELDARAINMDRAGRLLGMEVPVFVRAAIALLAFAMTSEPVGRVSLAGVQDRDFAGRYGVDADALRLAAFRLSATRQDVDAWITNVETLIPEGLRQFHPTILHSAPLLNADAFAPEDFAPGTFFLCPSLFHFVGAVRDHVREAICSAPGETIDDTRSEYGHLLEEYLVFICGGYGIPVVRVDDIDPHDEPHADLLLHEDDSGLIVELKRSLAPGIASRGLTRPVDVVSVLEHLLSAFQQCIATNTRRRWERRDIHLAAKAAIILVDETIGAEGGNLAELYVRQTQLDLPFEVFSIAEFEEALPVLGVKRMVAMIQEKFDRGMAGVPLAQYATKVLQMPRRCMQDARAHARPYADELFGLLQGVQRLYDAEWP